MDNNLSVDKIRSYSADFADTICNNFFKTHKKVTGNDILSITPVKQVNFFVLKNLFDVWEKESEKLKSNYFDYENAAVKNALQDFLNVLSQNISISRYEFEPLLNQAVQDALLLIISPYEFYRTEFNSWKGEIPIGRLKKFGKYIHINKHLIDTLVTRIESKDFGDLDVKKVLFIFDEVCEKSTDSPEDTDEYLNSLGKIKQVSTDDFYEKVESAPVYHKENKESELQEQKKILAETFLMNTPTLNEKFSAEKKVTLAEKLQKGKIQSIKASIPINQKFIYINNLFGGNIQDFAAVVDEIDLSPTFDEAKNLIHSRLVSKFKWDTRSEVFKDFLDTIERKYL